MKIKMEGTLIPVKIQYVVWGIVFLGVVFILGVLVGEKYPVVPEDPKQVLEMYNRLHQLSQSISDLRADIRAAEKDLAKLPSSFPADLRRQELEEELRAFTQMYKNAAKEYNAGMVVTGHRFNDLERLPDGAMFGRLPVQYPVNTLPE